MIDFRYHLVSLVSVFMALAIGVVLGAGPLQDSIGDTLSSQVDGLVQDKSDLQQAVENRDAQIADRDTFIDAVGERLTSAVLGGRDVVVLTLPGADSGTVDALTQQAESAGAQVTGQVDLALRWTDPEQAAARQDLVAELAPGEGGEGDADGSGAALAALLAAAVLTPEVAAQGQAAPDGASVLEALATGELVGVDGDPAARATLALVVAGAPEDSVGVDDAAWAQAAATSHLALLGALDAASAGVVVAGPVSAAADGGVLAQLRDDDTLAAQVSSVDWAETPMGRVTTVLALRQEMGGEAGQFGYGEGASAPVPLAADTALSGSGSQLEGSQPDGSRPDAGPVAGTDG